MRVTLTGATGYVGSVTVHALQRAGHDVIAVVRDASTDRARLVADTGASLVTADTTEVSAVLPQLDGVDVLVHTVPSDGEDGDRTLFESLADRDDVPHMVYVTGCSAFGRHRFIVLTEDTPTDPDHPRARLEKTLQESGLRHTIVRPAFLDEAADRSGAVPGGTSKTWTTEAITAPSATERERGRAWLADRLRSAHGAVRSPLTMDVWLGGYRDVAVPARAGRVPRPGRPRRRRWSSCSAP